ncbi:uncharacterized protein KQ657_000040 [Scheffersomyces spartinae]|uniref:PH-like domain-containing protein n=1 Tax=Scheffersomyces spartinae TaxID=45513 RepID=A0A9P7VE68_9ASCO|nr:uncharacterized protein KQ657_000040 [Scheffersomyces spartinae]KAG7196032.1 hypothetical protein KQ657_000040 [Scheffersomyces spartinae]
MVSSDLFTSVILTLAKSESEYTNSLVEMMATIQPTRGCSLSPVVRGLAMKNKKLSNLIHGYRIDNNEPDTIDTVDSFKVFVNNFLLWLDSDYLTLLHNYSSALFQLEQPLNLQLFAKPIQNCEHYIKFLDSCVDILRNPFVVETMSERKSQLTQALQQFNSQLESKVFSMISFENVQSYGAASSSAIVDKVSSFFSLDHIVERSGNEKFYLTHDRRQVACELVLLDFINTRLENYNALAILQIPANENEPRSLLYPPFRVNELSACLSNSKIILKPIDFVSVYDSPSFNENVCELILESIEPKALITWFKKLSTIFPVERNSSPIREKLISSATSSPVKMSGLGINLMSDCNNSAVDDDELSELGSPSVIKSNKSFADEQSTSSPLSQLQQKFDKGGHNNNSIADLQPPMIFSHGPRSNSFSGTSMHSIDSTPSEQDRANNLMAKTLSNNSLSHLESVIQSVNKLSLDTEDVSSKHHSAVAPIEYASPESRTHNDADALSPPKVLHQPYSSTNRPHFASVPDLNMKKPSLYKLNDGSEIDISNFGKSYIPSFASQSMADLSKPPIKLNNTELCKKKSFFSLFSKKSYKDTSKKAKPTAVESKKQQIQQVNRTPSPIKNDNVAAIDPLSGKGAFSLPSPFAIPNSDSMYFVKSRAGSSASLANDSSSPTGVATDLNISKELKDLINNSEDYYTSPLESNIKVSRWRSKSGQWVMLATDSSKMWLKISVNYALNKSWIIAFKETLELDPLEGENDEDGQLVDKPVLLLEIGDLTMLRRSGALDLQIQTLNPIINERMLVIIRSKSGSFIEELHLKLNELITQMSNKIRSSANRSMTTASRISSKSTLNSMAVDGLTSNSTTLTSINSTVFDKDTKLKALSPYRENTSLLVDQIDNFEVINKPRNNKLILLNEMPIRLQKQMESYESISNPSTWKIISMYSLTVYLISDMETNTDYYNLQLKNLSGDGKPDLSWLIECSNIWNRFQRLGKAGLLVNSSANEYYMLECKGKKQFKTLLETF